MTFTFDVQTKVVTDKMTQAFSAFGSTEKGYRVNINAMLIYGATAYESRIFNALSIQTF